MIFYKKFSIVLGSIVFAVLPLITSAYNNLKIEVYFDDGRIEVDADYYEQGREIERDFVFNTLNLQEAYALTADALGISITEVEDAVVRVDRNDEDDDSWDDNDEDDDDFYYESSSQSDAREAIADAREDISKAERVVNANLDKKHLKNALEDAKRFFASAEQSLINRSYGEAERWADRAEYLAEDIVAGRIAGDYVTHNLNYTPSTADIETLQKQIMVLLQQLITLLQAQQ